MTVFLNEVTYTVFIFSTFIGYLQPFTPSNPISIEEAYNEPRRAFYLAWYSEGEHGRRLYFFEKYWIRFSSVSVPDEVKLKIGRHYYAVDISYAVVTSKSISEKETINFDMFYMYVGDASGKTVVSAIVKKGLIDKY